MRDTRLQGFSAGFRDALSERPRRPKRHLSLLKSLFYSSYIKTFCAGYQHGHNAGLVKLRRQMETEILKETKKSPTLERHNHQYQTRLGELNRIKRGKVRGRDMER